MRTLLINLHHCKGNGIRDVKGNFEQVRCCTYAAPLRQGRKEHPDPEGAVLDPLREEVSSLCFMGLRQHRLLLLDSIERTVDRG